MRKVLVTGGTSFLGLRLVGRLLADGVETHVVLRPASDRTRLGKLAGRPAVHVHDGSADGLAAIVAAAGPDVVLHLASRYRREHRPEDVGPLIESNLTFGVMLLDAMRRAGAARLVNTGSWFQHADGAGARALNLYAALKSSFETVLGHYAEAHGLRATTLVLFDTYGEGDWRMKLLAGIRDAYRGGTPLRLPARDGFVNLVHADDVVEAYLIAARGLMDPRSPLAGKRFAVRLDGTHTIAGTVAAFEKVCGRALEKHWGAYPTADGEITAPWNGPTLPGWRPRIALEDGIRRFLAEPA